MYTYSPLDQPDVYRSLAIEDLLLDDGDGKEPVLFLWRSPKAVVLGKNQNPWKECNLQLLRENELALARRVTGGGAVYHDPGNLNICWALNRETYDPDVFHGILLSALKRWGIDGHIRKGGAVWVDGKKVSGCAFGFRRTKVLHHATLLIDADLGQLRSVLAPPNVRMQTHAVQSIPAPVVNLRQLNPEITPESMAAVLMQEAQNQLGEAESLTPWLKTQSLDAKTAEMTSRQWIWGQTPRFWVRIDIPGMLEFEVFKGKMQHIRWQGEELSEMELTFSPSGLEKLANALGVEGQTLAKAMVEGGWWM